MADETNTKKNGKLTTISGVIPRIQNIFKLLNEEKITSKTIDIKDIHNITILITTNYKSMIETFIEKHNVNIPTNVTIEYVEHIVSYLLPTPTPTSTLHLL